MEKWKRSSGHKVIEIELEVDMVAPWRSGNIPIIITKRDGSGTRPSWTGMLQKLEQ